MYQGTVTSAVVEQQASNPHFFLFLFGIGFCLFFDFWCFLCFYIFFLQIASGHTKGFTLNSVVIANVTYNGFNSNRITMGLIQGTSMNVYNCTFVNLTFYNDGEYEFGLFGSQYRVDSDNPTAITTNKWHFNNVLFENIYTNKFPLFFMTTDTLTATSEIKLTNVQFNDIECTKDNNDFMSIIAGFGGVVNGLSWELENIQVNNPIAEMFLYLEGKNVVEIRDFSYDTKQFDSLNDGAGFTGYLVIFYVDTVSSLDVTYVICNYKCSGCVGH